jgi:hypothetical protein
MRAMTRSLAAAMVLASAVVVAGSPPRGPADGGTATKRPKRATPMADAGTTAKVEVPNVQEAEPTPGGPTPGCPSDCYSSCGGGAARPPGAPPTERELRCRGCRNICMDTGRWPPSSPR